MLTAATITVPPAPSAHGAAPWRPVTPVHATSVAGRNQAPRQVQLAGRSVAAWKPTAITWPTAGSADVVLSSTGSRTAMGAAASLAKGATPGGLPISLSTATSGASRTLTSVVPTAVHLDVFDQDTADRAGVHGVMFRLTHPAGIAVAVDYSAFRDAIGGDWAARLRLVAMPDCVLTTPDRADCRTVTPVASANNVKTHRVTADDLTATASSAVYALAAAPGGGTGDYTATSLSASATWKVGEQTGDFDWSYPLRKPPVPGDQVPDVGLSYSSQSVDGHTASTNSQPSWAGEGFELLSGYVERSYRSCVDAGGPAHNGDQCWGGDNASVMINGKASELIRDDSTGVWRFKNDDGSRVEKLTGATNGAHNGEYWRITTTDGVQYTFGINHEPGWVLGKATTNSTWTEPVFGANSGDPCYSSAGFQSSWCQQAWRWNLDYVVDPRGNASTYWYTAETNYYMRGYAPDSSVTGTSTVYTRGGYLREIDYGLRSSSLFTNPAAKVVFGVSERCITSTSFNCETTSNFSKANASHWPDVPYDQNCSSTDACKTNIAPTFWSRKRLTSITTQVQKGSGYQNVDTWTLSQSFPAPGDGTTASLWLDSITHTGDVNGTLATPPVVFGKTQLANRVDTNSDHLAQFDKYRVGTIDTESGAHLTITYSVPDCSGTDKPSPQNNHRLCYPVYWSGDPAQSSPFQDWFRKYVVAQIVQSDLTGGAPNQLTTYDYSQGTPAWHFDDADGLVKDKYRTWGQWHGYNKVSVIQGVAGQQRSETDYLYYQGMDADRSDPSDASKTKTVTLTDSHGIPVTDLAPAQGQIREKIDINGPGGTVVDNTVTTPSNRTTATRVRSWGTTTASLVNTASSVTRTTLAAGGWRTTETDTTYDSNGLTTQVNDLGDTSSAADDRCTRTTYAQDTDTWMIAYPDRVESVAVACGATPQRPNDVISDARTFYDNLSFGTAPTLGNLTSTDKIASYTGTTPAYVIQAKTVYDAYGRVTQSSDALGRKTTTAYTPAAGPVTRTVVTDNLGYATTTDLDPSWGAPLDTIDPNSKRTDATYDALGRTARVWLPGRSESANAATPNMAYSYKIGGSTAPTATTTTTLTSFGTYATSVQIYDGLLRPRQTQTQSPGGGRTITDTFYDTRGLVARANSSYYNGDSGPSTTLFTPTAAVPGQTVTTYDGIGRAIVAQFLQDGSPKWQSSMSYGGDRVNVTPPTGGVATTTVADARGQTTRLLQYHGGTPSGPVDTTSYTYTPAGQLATLTDAAGNAWTYRFDLRGRRIEANDPDTGKTTTTFNDDDQILSLTDARGSVLAYTYDGLGRKTALYAGSTAGTMLAQWGYDTIAKGLATSSTRYVNGMAYSSSVTGFDDRYNPTGTKTVIPVDPSTSTAQQALAGSYLTYASANTSTDGSPHSITLPSGGGLPGETVAYTYDEVGEPVSFGGLASYVSGATYSKIGQLLELGMSDGSGHLVVRTNTFEDGTGRLSRVIDQRSTAPNTINDLHYGYDDAGDITSAINAQGDGQTDSQCFGYDYLQRVVNASSRTTASCTSAPSTSTIGGPAPYWQSFSYDVTGNRTGETDHATAAGGADTVHAYGYPSAASPQPHTVRSVTTGARTDSYTYDAAGHTTGRDIAGAHQTLTWDPEGRLVAATGGTSLYDADGHQLIATGADGATLYLPGMQIHADSHGLRTATRYYAFAGQTIAARTNSGLSFVLTNDQNTGETTVSADAVQTLTRRYFTPYGQTRGTTQAIWPGTKTFVGGTDDPSTGLVTVGAREYDPTIGVFLSRDTVIDPNLPQQINGYTYASDSPVTLSDPTGLAQGPPGALCGSPSCWPTANNPGEAYQVNGGCYTCNPSTWHYAHQSWQTVDVIIHAVADAYLNYRPHRPGYPAFIPKEVLNAPRLIRKTLLARQLDSLQMSNDQKRYQQFKTAYCTDYPEDEACGSFLHGFSRWWGDNGLKVTIGAAALCQVVTEGACTIILKVVVAADVTANTTDFISEPKSLTSTIRWIDLVELDILGLRLLPVPRMEGRTLGDTLYNRYMGASAFMWVLIGIGWGLSQGP
jgi:RHS repeat-associated protein